MKLKINTNGRLAQISDYLSTEDWRNVKLNYGTILLKQTIVSLLKNKWPA